MAKDREYMRRYRGESKGTDVQSLKSGQNSETVLKNDSVINGISDIDISQVLNSSTFPAMKGANERDIAEGKRARGQFRQAMLQYATSRDDNGRPISAEYATGYLTGSAQDRSEFVKKRAISLSFGNDALYAGKLSAEIELQQGLAARVMRLREIMTSKSTAGWWKNAASSASINAFAKKYIDGKLSAADARAVFGL